MTRERTVIAVVLALLLAGAGILIGWPPPNDEAAAVLIARSPAEGMVTMIDLGAGTCVPCRMMAPILKDVRQEYGYFILLI